jgi:hypothetical protein
MGLHDSLERLKHKLWLKEGLIVKLTIWLSTINSQESSRFPCVQVACNIFLERSWWGLQLFFKPHLNRRSTQKVMGPQSRRSPNFENFETPIWESWDKMTFECYSCGHAHSILKEGKVVASPKFEPWWSCESVCCPWLVYARKCSNYALTNLLFGFLHARVSNWISC